MSDVSITRSEPLVLDFTTEGDLSFLRLGGFSEQEPHGTWVVGNDAWIELGGLDPARDYACELHVRPFVAPPVLVGQTIVISFSGVELLRARVSSSENLQFRIPAAAIERGIAPGGSLELAIQCPDAASPSSLGVSSDSRVLAFAFARATFVPVSGVERETPDPAAQITTDTDPRGTAVVSDTPVSTAVPRSSHASTAKTPWWSALARAFQGGTKPE